MEGLLQVYVYLYMKKDLLSSFCFSLHKHTLGCGYSQTALLNSDNGGWKSSRTCEVH